MSDEAGLKIIIGADIQAAQDAIGAVSGSLAELGKSGTTNLQKVGTAMQELNKATAATTDPAKVKILTAAYQNLGDQVKKINASGANSFTPITTETANRAASSIQNIGQSLVTLNNTVDIVPERLRPVVDSFLTVITQTNLASNAVKGLGLVLSAGIVGVGVAAAAATIGYLAYNYYETSKAEKEAAESAKKFADEQRSSAEQIQKQIIEVQSLVRIAQSDASTKTQQANALSRLNDLIPDNIGKVNALNIKTSEGISIIRDYTKALEDEATAQLLIGRAATLRVQKFDDEKKAQDAIAAIEKLRADAQARMIRGSNEATPEQKQSDAFRTGSTILLKQIDDYDKQINVITDNLNISRHKLDEQLTALRDGIDQNTAGGLPTVIKTQKTGKETDPLTDQIKALQNLRDAVGLTAAEYQKLQDLKVQVTTRDQVKLGLDSDQLAREIARIKSGVDEYETTIKRLETLKKDAGLTEDESKQLLDLQVKVSLADQSIDGLNNDQLQRKIEAEVGDSGVHVPWTLAMSPDTVRELEKQFGTLSPVAIPFTMKLADLGVQGQRLLPTFSTPLDVFIPDQDLVDAEKKIDATKALIGQNPINIVVGADTSAARKSIEQLREGIITALRTAATDAFTSIGEAIGTALAGGNIQNVLGNFLNVLADGLENIGKAMIAYGVAREILNRVGEIEFDPIVAIAAGVGVVAAGAALKTAFTKRNFAEGGIVYSPTHALIGESGPEVVFPLRQLNSFVGQLGGRAGDGQTFIPNLTIKGSDLLIVFNREKNRFGSSFS